jgi:hypothetical protein
MNESDGHLAVDMRFEFFQWDGEVYRAPLECPMRVDVSVRNGARWFARTVTAAIALGMPEPLCPCEGTLASTGELATVSQCGCTLEGRDGM